VIFLEGKVLGLSSELKVHTVASEKSLRKWLATNEVTVLDIKYSITPQDQDVYLIIYK
jgi:hypothetical protein